MDHAKQSATDTLKTASKRAIEKAAEKIGDLFGSKVVDLIFKTSQQNNSEVATNEHDKEIPNLYIYIYIYIQKKEITLLMI